MGDYQGHPDQYFGGATYSQHGEDLMLLNIFKLIGLEKGGYLDLGAHHPENISNTKLLYDRGWRGVNVEANADLIPAFLKERPEDITLNIGVGTAIGQTATFRMFDRFSGLNSFDPQVERFGVTETREVPITTVDRIVDRVCGGVYPHLLLSDVEGWDYQVLEGADLGRRHYSDWRYATPHVICVETRRDETEKMKSLLSESGFFLYCRMGENCIFVRNGFRKYVY